MKQQPRFYHDGFIILRKEKIVSNDFTKKSNEHLYDTVLRLRFSTENIREDDADFIESHGHTLSLKVKVPFVRLDFPYSSLDALVTNYEGTSKEYTVVYSNPSKDHSENYLYLEEGVVGNAE